MHDLWAKALALEEPVGRRAVLITLDVCGIDRELSDRIRDTLQMRHKLGRDRIVIACSHTHCGPVVGTNLLTMYKIDDAERNRIAEYAKTLETTVVNVAGEALDRLQDARMSWGNGRCEFAVNRRANREADVPKLRQRLALQGPDDHDVPVLRVARPDGSLMAVVFGYACHCTVLDFYKFSGDYAGFAQVDLETRFPARRLCSSRAAAAIRIRSPGAARPGRDLREAARYQRGERPGHAHADDRRVDGIGLRGDPARLRQPPDARAARARHSVRQLLHRQPGQASPETIESLGHLEPDYPYPVQAWRLDGLTWIFLGGEVVVNYSLRLKRNLGSSHTWVSAYCNDVMAYIPSKRVLKEGGYEGARP